MNKLICEEGCQQLFDVNDMKIGKEAYSGGIERHYLECPHCKHKYTSYYTDDNVRALQLEVIALKNKGALNMRQRNKMNALIRQMQTMSDEIKNRIETMH